MRTHLRVTAAALIFVGLATGCSRTTEGTVAHDHPAGTADRVAVDAHAVAEPGFPGIPGLPNIPGLPQIPGFPMPGNTDVPDVPAPAGWDTMKCSDFTKLDEATQLAVVKAILEGPRQLDAGIGDGRGADGDDHVRVPAQRRRQRGGDRRVAAVSG